MAKMSIIYHQINWIYSGHKLVIFSTNDTLLFKKGILELKSLYKSIFEKIIVGTYLEQLPTVGHSKSALAQCWRVGALYVFIVLH